MNKRLLSVCRLLQFCAVFCLGACGDDVSIDWGHLMRQAQLEVDVDPLSPPLDPPVFYYRVLSERSLFSLGEPLQVDGASLSPLSESTSNPKPAGPCPAAAVLRGFLISAEKRWALIAGDDGQIERVKIDAGHCDAVFYRGRQP